jgi:hypothetical protein
MATLIKETPILEGRDASKFLKKMKKAETEKASEAELARIKQNAQRLKTIFKD